MLHGCMGGCPAHLHGGGTPPTCMGGAPCPPAGGGCPAHLHGLHSRGGVPRPPAWLTQPLLLLLLPPFSSCRCVFPSHPALVPG